MTQAILASFLATFLWAITDFIDKFLVSRGRNTSNNIKSLLVFSTLIAGAIFAPISLVLANFNVEVNLISFLSAIAASIIYILATLCYYYALNKNDASSIVSMFQLTPVFTYLFSFIFYGETFTLRQIIGASMIMMSSIAIGLSLKNRRKEGKYRALIMSILAAILYGLNYSLMDTAIRNSNYDACYFWNQIGFLGIGIVLIGIKSYRRAFKNAVRNNGKGYFILNSTNELLNSAAGALVNYANTLIPIAFVNIISGFEGAISFILGAIGVKILPRFFKENLKKKTIIRKIICIIVSIIGLILFML